MENPKSYRLHPILVQLIDEQSKKLETSRTWIIEAAVAEFLGDELRARYPHYRPGMPHREDKQ